MAEESSSQQQQSPKDTSDLEEGGATTEDANGNAPPPEKHVAPHRGIHRSIGTHALPCLVVHVFHIDKEAKVEPFEDHHAGLLEALSAEKNDIDTPVGIPTDSNKEGKHREKNGGKDKDISLQRSYWVDIDADERDRPEVNEWIQKLNFGSLITDTITKPAEEWVSHVVSTRSKALIMIRIVPLVRDDGSFVSENIEYLAAVKTKHMVLTYTTTLSGGRGSLNKASIKYMTMEDALHDGSSNAALVAWLEFHIFRTRKILTHIRRDSLQIAKRQDQDPNSVRLEEITILRHRLLVVLSVAEEQSQCLFMIQRMDEDTDCVDFKQLKGPVSILISTAESTERMGARLEKRGKALRQAYDANQQDQMNRRLALLTIASVIFMPLTFLSGIFGMNFANMPVLELENGFYGLLVTMLVITIAMPVGFHYYGWFV